MHGVLTLVGEGREMVNGWLFGRLGSDASLNYDNLMAGVH